VNLSAAELVEAWRAAADHLSAAASAIDAINVYPVPDGDTGSNMAATMRAAVAGIGANATDASTVLETLARGALYGARGNSGVILSQALRGLADGAGRVAEIDARALQRGLREAARKAYAAIAEPQEGTMLTVLRVAAESAKGDDCLTVLRSATEAAERAEAETIEQLPRLKEAGVTDAGGEGICAIFRALTAHLAGVPLPAVRATDAPLAKLVDHGTDFGFCCEFIAEPAGSSAIDIAQLRALVQAGTNRSAIVVGDEWLARVHVHSDDAEALLTSAAALARLSRVKVDDMGRQHQRLQATGSGATAGVALLALCEGAGFANAFDQLGAVVLLQRGDARPSVGEVQRAIDAIGAPVVFVLPNHKDLVPVAQQAAGLARAEARVIESRTVPQGLSAALAFDATMPIEELERELARGPDQVRTIEVTIATADRLADGVAIAAGDAIALVDGHVVAAEKNLPEALRKGLERAGAGDESMLTLYTGAGEEGPGWESTIRGWYPGCDVQVMAGGQRLYPLIASVE
jgi:hypothetical protein